MSDTQVAEQASVILQEQKQYVQAGLAYLQTLYDLPDLFKSFDMKRFDVGNAGTCVLAQASEYEGQEPGSYYAFITDHILPESPKSLGFLSNYREGAGDDEQVLVDDALNACWVAAINGVLAG